MMRILLSFLGVLLMTASLCGQSLDDTKCKEKLDVAKQSYQAGQLDEVKSLIGDCLEAKVFKTRESMVDGYKLLTESYLFRNNATDSATVTFEKLLTYEPLFEADSTDPNTSYDLIYLSRTYKSKPVVSVYMNAGLNYTRPEILQYYSTDNVARPAENYNQFTLGYSAALGMEIPIWRDFTLAIEGNFVNRTYNYLDSLFLSGNLNNPEQDDLMYSTLQFKEVQWSVDIPVMIRYEYYFKQKKLKKIIPFAFIGAAPNFIMTSKLHGLQRSTTRVTTGGGEVLGGEFIGAPLSISGLGLNSETPEGETALLPLRNMVNVMLMAGIGAKFRVGRNFIVFEARYNRYLLNSVNINNRYNNKELIYEYGYVDNDFRIDNLALTLGFEKSFYKPRKKRIYNPLFVNNRLNKILKKEKANAKRTTDAELKREMNAFIRDLERDKPGMLEDVRRGRTSSKVIEETIQKAKDIKK